MRTREVPRPAASAPREVCSGSHVLRVENTPGGVAVTQCRESRDPASLGAAVPLRLRTRRINVEATAGPALADAIEEAVGPGPATDAVVDDRQVVVADGSCRILVSVHQDRWGRTQVRLAEIDPRGRPMPSEEAATIWAGAVAARALARLLREVGVEAPGRMRRGMDGDSLMEEGT